MLNIAKFPELRRKKLIGIGETVHGSNNLHYLGSLLIRSAIENVNVRKIGIEAPDGVIKKINEKLSDIDAQEITLKDLEPLYRVWRSEYILNLLNWIKRFNDNSHDTKVEVFGFDIRGPEQELKELYQFAKLHLPENSLASLNIDAREIRNLEMLAYQGQFNESQKRFSAIASTINDIRKGTKGRSDRIEFLIDRISGWTSVYLTWKSSDMGPSYVERDKQMFWLLKEKISTTQGTAPILVLAHFNHLIYDNLAVKGAKEHLRYGHALGNHLKNFYGDDYSLIGLFSSELEVKGEDTSQKFRSNPGSFESILAKKFGSLTFESTASLGLDADKWIPVGDVDPANDPLLTTYSQFKMRPSSQLDYFVIATKAELRP